MRLSTTTAKQAKKTTNASFPMKIQYDEEEKNKMEF